MRLLACLALPALALAAQEPRPWTAPGKGAMEFRIFAPAATPAPFVLIFGGGPEADALGAALVRAGLGAAALQHSDPRLAAAAWGMVTAHPAELGFRADRAAVAAVGDGARTALHLTMEERVPARGLVLLSCWAPVIEGLRADLPLLLSAVPGEPDRRLAGMRELAHQASLSGAPVHLETGTEPAASAAQFLAARLLPPPDPAAVTDGEHALQLARARADAGDAAGARRWLDRTAALGAPTAHLATDGSLARLRHEPPISGWLREHAPSGEVFLVPGHEAGRQITLNCKVADHLGAPMAGVLLELWQTDALGMYSHTGGGDERARLRAFVRADDAGAFTLHSVRPGGYPATMIPAHIHLRVHREGRPWNLEILFADDPRLSPEHEAEMTTRGWPVVTLTGRGFGEAVLRAPR